MGLDRVSVLRPAKNFGWEFGNILVPVWVFENLCSILGDQSTDFDVDHLPGFIACYLIGHTGGDGTLVNLNGYDIVRVFHRLKRLAFMAFLPTGFAGAFGAGLLLSVRVC